MAMASSLGLGSLDDAVKAFWGTTGRVEAENSNSAAWGARGRRESEISSGSDLKSLSEEGVTRGVFTAEAALTEVWLEEAILSQVESPAVLFSMGSTISEATNLANFSKYASPA